MRVNCRQRESVARAIWSRYGHAPLQRFQGQQHHCLQYQLIAYGSKAHVAETFHSTSVVVLTFLMLANHWEALNGWLSTAVTR